MNKKYFDNFATQLEKKADKIAKDVFDKIDYKEEEIEHAIINHHSYKKLQYIEKQGISLEAIIEKAQDIIDDIMDEMDYGTINGEVIMNEDLTSYILSAIASYMNTVANENIIYTNEMKRLKEEANKKDESKNVLNTAVELYANGKLTIRDLAMMVKYNSIKLTDISTNLGFEVANEVLNTLQDDFENGTLEKDIEKPKEAIKEEKPSLEKELDSFFNIMNNVESMTFDEFRNKMNSFSDETKDKILDVVTSEIESSLKNKNLKPFIVKVPINFK